MKEHPAIFSTEMIPKILDKQKTMTRRAAGLKEINEYPDLWVWFGYDNSGRYSFRFKPGDRILSIRCPYGQVGDRLWVRETWAAPKEYDALSPVGLWDKPKIWYLADGIKPIWAGKTRSSLFLPRWASRILLEITEVRVERLNQITPEDCLREGLTLNYQPANALTPRFHLLWDSLNAKGGHGWDKNDWVWVIGFTLIAHQEVRV